jgi:hypothetical protein
MIKAIKKPAYNSDEDLSCINFCLWAQTYKGGYIWDFLFHIGNERKCSPRFGYKLKLMGVKPGVCDYFLMIPNQKYSGMFIEMKNTDRRKAKISPFQKKFLANAKSKGYHTVICYGLDEAVQTVLEYLSI